MDRITQLESLEALEEHVQDLKKSNADKIQFIFISVEENENTEIIEVDTSSRINSLHDLLFLMAYLGAKFNITEIFEPKFKKMSKEIELSRYKNHC